MEEQMQHPMPAASLSGSEENFADALVVPELSRTSLARLRENDLLSAEAWDAAMAFCGFRPDARAWQRYWRHILLLGGALFLAAGVIFFIASNWADMHRFSRMGTVAALVAAAGVSSLLAGLDTAPGRALLLFCGICAGPLMAVFGQTYQTGAELWELFRVWTAVLFVLALAGRQAGLWFVTWLVANVFVMLWLGRSLDSPLEALGMFSLLPECVLGLVLAVTAWEVAAFGARQKSVTASRAWLQSRWLPRLLFFDLTVRLTSYLTLLIFDDYILRHGMELILPRQIIPLIAVAVAGVAAYWYRKKTPDLFMFACLVSAGGILVVAVLLRAEFLFEAGVGAFFMWGLILVGLTAGVASILLALQREMASNAAEQSPIRPKFSFFAPVRSLPDWNTLWTHLQDEELVDEDEALPLLEKEKTPASAPWYVRFVLAVGGWVAGLVFLAFMGLFLFETLNIRDNEGAALTIISCIPLAVACICLKTPGAFLRNFGFSLAITGTVGVLVGLGLALKLQPGLESVLPFLFAAILAALCPVMNSGAYRFLAAFMFVQLVAVGFVAAIAGGVYYADLSVEDVARIYRRGHHTAAAWWVGVSLALVAFSLREKDWRGQAWSKYVEPLFFGIFGGMMGYCIAALALRISMMGTFYGLGMSGIYLPSGAYGIGLGAGVGLLFFANAVTRDQAISRLRTPILICAALCLPLGWYLPGVALAGLGLALSRYLSSFVMQGVSCAFLFAYMIYYYYFLGVPLMQKSLLLAATGVALLCLSWGLNRLGMQEADHA